MEPDAVDQSRAAVGVPEELVVDQDGQVRVRGVEREGLMHAQVSLRARHLPERALLVVASLVADSQA